MADFHVIPSQLANAVAALRLLNIAVNPEQPHLPYNDDGEYDPEYLPGVAGFNFYPTSSLFSAVLIFRDVERYWDYVTHDATVESKRDVITSTLSHYGEIRWRQPAVTNQSRSETAGV